MQTQRELCKYSTMCLPIAAENHLHDITNSHVHIFEYIYRICWLNLHSVLCHWCLCNWDSHTEECINQQLLCAIKAEWQPTSVAPSAFFSTNLACFASVWTRESQLLHELDKPNLTYRFFIVFCYRIDIYEYHINLIIGTAALNVASTAYNNNIAVLFAPRFAWSVNGR